MSVGRTNRGEFIAGGTALVVLGSFAAPGQIQSRPFRIAFLSEDPRGYDSDGN